MSSSRIIYISSLIKKNLLGEITLEEQQVLEQWLDESPKHRELFRKYQNPDFLLSIDKRKDLSESKIAYSRFMEKVKFRPRSFYMKRYVVAASLIAFVCLASILVYWNMDKSLGDQAPISNRIVNTKGQEPEAMTADALLLTADGEAIPMNNSQEVITVSSGNIKMGNQSLLEGKDDQIAQQKIVYSTLKILRGKKYKLKLSDGTMVWLNAESEITFPNRFDETSRTVSVKGELLFDVTENKSCPFIVNTQQGNIRVLGTVFNIHCYENETPATTLVRGKIEYSFGGKSVILHPGQQCRVSNNNLSVVNVDTYEYTSWIDEIIYFKDKRLEEIMNTLSRLYDVNITYENQSLKKLPFTGGFKQYEHLDDIIQMIEECGLIHIERNGNELVIKKE